MSKDIVARWIKSTLAAARINVKLFTPHSTRSASNSKAVLHKLIEIVLKTGGGAACLQNKINQLVMKMNLQMTFYIVIIRYACRMFHCRDLHIDRS